MRDICVGKHPSLGICVQCVGNTREIFTDEGTEGVLLIDVSNAFNSLDRRAALLNMYMFHLCRSY